MATTAQKLQESVDLLFDEDDNAYEFKGENFYSVPFVLLDKKVQLGSSIDPNIVISKKSFIKANGSLHWAHAKTVESILKVFDRKYLSYIDATNPNSAEFLRSLHALAHAVAPQLQKSLEVLYDESMKLTDFDVDIDGNPLNLDAATRAQMLVYRRPQLVDSTIRERWMTRNLARIREYLYWVSVAGGSQKKNQKPADIVAIMQRLGVPLSAQYAHLAVVPETPAVTVESDEDFDTDYMSDDEAPSAKTVQPGQPIADGFSQPPQAVPQFATPAPSPSQSAAPAPSPSQFAAPAPSPAQFAAPAPSPAQFATPAPSPAQFAAPAPSPVQFAAAAAGPSPPNAGQLAVLSPMQLQAFQSQEAAVRALRDQVLAQQEQIEQYRIQKQTLDQRVALADQEKEHAVLRVTAMGKQVLEEQARRMRQEFLDEKNGLFLQFNTGAQNLEAEKQKVEQEKKRLQLAQEQALKLKDAQLAREEAEKQRLASEKDEIAARAAQQSQQALTIQQTAATRAQERFDAQAKEHAQALKDHLLAVQKLNDQIVSHRASMTAAVQKSESLERELLTAKAETQAERAKNQKSATDISKLNVQLGEVEAQLQTAKQTIATQNLTIESQKKDLLDKKAQAAASSAGSSGAPSSASSAGGGRSEQRIRDLEADLKKEQAKYVASNIEHTKMTTLYEGVQPKLEELRKKRRELEKKVADLENQVAVLTSKLSTADQLGAAMRSLSGGQQPVQPSSSNAPLSALEIALLQQQLATAKSQLAARDSAEAMWNADLPIAQESGRSIVPSFEADGSLRRPPGSVLATHTAAELFNLASLASDGERASKTEAAALKTEKATLEFELRTAKGELETMKLELAALGSIPTKKSQQAANVAALQLQLATAIGEKNQLDAEMQIKSADHVRLSTELAAAESALFALKLNPPLRADLDKVQAEKDALELEILRLTYAKNELEAAQKENERLQSEIRVLESRVNAVPAIDPNAERLHDLEMEKIRLGGTIASLEATVAASRGDYVRIGELQTRIKELEKQLEDAFAVGGAASSSIDPAIRKQVADKLHAVQQQLGIAAAANDSALLLSLMPLEQQLRAELVDIDSRSSSISGSDPAEIAQLREALQEAEEKLRLRPIVAAPTNSFADPDEISKLEAKLQRVQQSYTKALEQVDLLKMSATVEKRTTDGEIARLTADVARLESERDDAVQQMANLATQNNNPVLLNALSQLKARNSTIAQLKAELQSAQTQLLNPSSTALQIERQEDGLKIAELTRLLTAAQDEAAQLGTEVADLKIEIDDLKKAASGSKSSPSPPPGNTGFFSFLGGGSAKPPSGGLGIVPRKVLHHVPPVVPSAQTRRAAVALAALAMKTQAAVAANTRSRKVFSAPP